MLKPLSEVYFEFLKISFRQFNNECSHKDYVSLCKTYTFSDDVGLIFKKKELVNFFYKKKFYKTHKQSKNFLNIILNKVYVNE